MLPKPVHEYIVWPLFPQNPKMELQDLVGMSVLL